MLCYSCGFEIPNPPATHFICPSCGQEYVESDGEVYKEDDFK